MINGKAFIVYVDETTVIEDVTTTMSPPPVLASVSNAQPLTPMSTEIPSIVYTETTVFQDVTTTLVVKRHAHHARAHGHR
jgi:hypothetical protein